MAPNAFLPPFIVKNLVIILKYELLFIEKVFLLSNSLITTTIKINTNEQKTSFQECYHIFFNH